MVVVVVDVEGVVLIVVAVVIVVAVDVEVTALSVVAKVTVDAGALDVAAEELGVVVVVVDVEGIDELADGV